MTTTINKRFFAFGCSFTRYSYPTWADIIGYNFSEYYNFGQPGCGNYYIFNAVVEANRVFNFDNNDVIIIEWSNEQRHDAFIDDRWYLGLHNIKDYVQFHDWTSGSIMKTLSFMNIIEEWLNLKMVECFYLTVVPFENFNKLSKNYTPKKYHEKCVANDLVFDNIDFLKCYENTVNKIKISFNEFLGDFESRPKWIDGVEVKDWHPAPYQYYDYVAHVFPQYLPDYDKLRDELIKCYDQAVTNQDFFKDSWNTLQNTNWPIPIGKIENEKVALTTIYTAL